MKNLNEVAVEICKLEGGKKNLSIAQVKEVLKCLTQLQTIAVFEDPERSAAMNGLSKTSPVGLIALKSIKEAKKAIKKQNEEIVVMAKKAARFIKRFKKDQKTKKKVRRK